MMKKTIFYVMLTAVITLGITSCGKDDSADPTTNNGGNNNNPPAKTKTEILAKKWIVDEAYVDGTKPDNSSKGLKFDIRADGTYTLTSTGYVGTWEFIENETKIDWDKGTQYHQTFTLDVFSETKIDATFVSVFTGQNARWVMIPQ